MSYYTFFFLQSTCPLHMQSLAVIDKAFNVAPSGFKLYGDVVLYQVAHLPCVPNVIDTKYNNSLLNYRNKIGDNVVDFILESYFHREGKYLKNSYIFYYDLKSCSIH